MSQVTRVEIATVHRFITQGPEGVNPKHAWGETSYFYNPGGLFDQGTYFATIKQHDGDNDQSSDLDRNGVWRLNLGISKGAYLQRFGSPPPGPGKGGVIEGEWDFTALDQLTPHPVYGWMSWVSVLNPSRENWGRCLPLLLDAHERARKTFQIRLANMHRS